jgi:hypothetical protein
MELGSSWGTTSTDLLIRSSTTTPALLQHYPWDGATLGIWDGTSGYFNYVVTVSEDGKTFTGKQNGTSEVPGPDPYVGTGTSYTGITLSAKKIEVKRSLLPQP